MVHPHEDKNEEPIYQGHKHMNYSREKRLSRRSCCLHNANNNRFFERRYGNLFGGEYEVKENSDEGDRILYYVTCLLNCNVWCKPDDGNNEELLYAKQLQSLSKVYFRFARMGI